MRRRPTILSSVPTDPTIPDFIDFHVSLARDTGIDGFIVSWSGPRSMPDTIFRRMLDQGEKAHRGFRLCVLYENIASNPNLSVEKVYAELAYVMKEYAHRRTYLRVDGNPVLFVYNPQSWPAERWRGVLSTLKKDYGSLLAVAVPDGWDFDTGYLSVFDSVVPYADKYYTDEALRDAYSRAAARLRPAHKPVIVAAIGGGSRIRKLGFDMDRSEGRYLRRRLTLAQAVGADWMTLTSWNEWYEGMQIEPSREYGFEGVKYVRETAAAFTGKALASVERALLSASVNATGGRREWTVSNTGRCNIYAVTAGAGGKRVPVAYVLHPGEKVRVRVDSDVEEVSGFRADAEPVRAIYRFETRSLHLRGVASASPFSTAGGFTNSASR
jgi:hypothetical protein